MLAIQKYTNTINCYLNSNTPKYIVVHYVGAQSSTALNNCKYFAGGDRQASAHYFVDDTSIWQCIEDQHGAWHVGNTRTEVNNKNSLGIEMCCMGPNLMVTEKTEANTVDLVKYLMNKYNIPVANVRTHYQVSGGTKTCPNWSANNWARWNNFKAKLTNSKPVQADTSNVFRVIVDGKSVIALTGQNKAINYAKTNYPNKYVQIQNVKTGAIVLELNKPQSAHVCANEVCRIFVNGTQKISLTGLAKCENYARANYKGTIMIQCSKCNKKLKEFAISDHECKNSLCRILVNGTQKIALTGLDKCKQHAKNNFPGSNVKIVCSKCGKVLDDFKVAASAPTPTPAPAVNSINKYVNLYPVRDSWRVYSLSATNLTPGNECGSLNPKLYGGLSYLIIKEYGNDIYAIRTSMFGTVKIYCPNDNEGCVSTTKKY